MCVYVVHVQVSELEVLCCLYVIREKDEEDKVHVWCVLVLSVPSIQEQ